MSLEKKVILVTGGSGLVGKAMKKIAVEDPQQNEELIFLSTKDGNLM